MKRLTENGQIILDGTLAKCEKEQIILERYSQIEDIEQELGIDLITLFKALKNGIYEKIEDGESVAFDPPYWFIKPHKLHLDLLNKYIWHGNDKFYFKDYGKTWALDKKELTKEELL